MHQQNHCSGHDMTINRPHASRPTPNQPGMQGSKWERRPTGWPHRGAPRPPTTIPTNTTEQVTLPLRTRPTNVNKLHYTTLGQTKTQLTSTDTVVPATQTTFGDTTTGSSATEPTQTNDHEAAKTTAHQPHRSCSRHLTINRPHASRPTPNQPGVHGSKRERRQTGWRHRGAPRPPTTRPTNTAEHRNSTVTNATNQCQQTTQHYTWTNQDATNHHRHGRAGYTQHSAIRPPEAARWNPRKPSRP